LFSKQSLVHSSSLINVSWNGDDKADVAGGDIGHDGTAVLVTMMTQQMMTVMLMVMMTVMTVRW
jgi:hypothetical protein